MERLGGWEVGRLAKGSSFSLCTSWGGRGGKEGTREGTGGGKYLTKSACLVLRTQLTARVDEVDMVVRDGDGVDQGD